MHYRTHQQGGGRKGQKRFAPRMLGNDKDRLGFVDIGSNLIVSRDEEHVFAENAVRLATRRGGWWLLGCWCARSSRTTTELLQEPMFHRFGRQPRFFVPLEGQGNDHGRSRIQRGHQ